MKVYQRIAHLLIAIQNCEKSGNLEWKDKHSASLLALLSEAPSSSGIDNGSRLLDGSNPDRLRFAADFHHMNEGGMYDGWTEHTVTVRPSLAFDLHITVSGRNRNDIKDYLTTLFLDWLTEESPNA